MGKYPDFWGMSFSKEIVRWYVDNKRDLPWRDTRDPYIIWLSEVILQQTRVEQGRPYFERFLANYPTVSHFSQASEGEILRHWQGLGYYSRARNMHKATKLVVEDMRGVFPSTYDDLIQLPGVGEYTAAAISSFASGEARAVVDGNVFRVLARYFGIDTPINSTKGKKIFMEIAQDILDKVDPATHNQAMMEFGALLCRPKNPLCDTCPISIACIALKTDRIKTLPIKTKSKPSINRYFNYFLVKDKHQPGLFMVQRATDDIWANLYEFPLIETSALLAPNELADHAMLSEWFSTGFSIVPVSGVVKHVLSHQNLHAQFFEVRGAFLRSENTVWDYVLLKDLNNLAKPKLIYSFLTNYLNIHQT